MRKNSGITLITLVITTIVMLILAGISINMTIGNGGIFNTTQKAIDTTTNETELEELNVIIEQCLNDSMIQGYGAYITDRALYVSIKEVIGYSNDGTLKDVKVSKTNEGDYLITFIETKRQYSISKSGEISEEYTYVDNIESITDIFKGITDESVIE